jgi:hypothetical protein
VNKAFYIVLFFFLLGSQTFFGQVSSSDLVIAKDTAKVSKTIVYDPLRPSKAAFYSALLPGLGQAYNKSYWKIPIVYGAIGTSLYFYFNNNKKYDYLDDDRLIRAQRFYQRNRDLSLLVAVGFYVLNIVDANVDAHLTQFNVNDNLSIVPDLQQSDFTVLPNLGLTLNYKF